MNHALANHALANLRSCPGGGTSQTESLRCSRAVLRSRMSGLRWAQEEIARIAVTG
jgi:hypothetical protein